MQEVYYQKNQEQNCPTTGQCYEPEEDREEDQKNK